MGLEYITQPQVFLGGLTALGPGIQGLTENYPLLTTYNYWTSTSNVSVFEFPIPGSWSIFEGSNNSASFIVSIGGVVQAPDTYTIDTINRTILFLTPVEPNIEVAVTQLATAAPSSQEFSFIKVLSGNFENSTFQNVTATNLTVISSTTFDTTIFTFTTATDLTAVNGLFTNLTVTDFLSTSNVQVSSLSIESLTVVSSNVFQATTLANLVSALAVTVNGDTVYLPLLSAV
jgi:hypothetical protein